MGKPHGWRRSNTGNTTARGYGNDHQKERRRRVATATEHDPCGYCGQPLGPDKHEWHLPHNADRTGYLPGLWHGRCNRSEGARRGRRKQMRTVRTRTSRAW